MFSNLSTVPAGSSDTSSRVTSFPRSIRSCVIAISAYRIQHQFMRASRSRSAPIAKHRASCSLAHNPRARCSPTAWPCFQIAGLLWLCTRLRPSEGQTDLARPDARAPAPRGETSLGGPARAAASRALPCSSCSMRLAGLEGGKGARVDKLAMDVDDHARNGRNVTWSGSHAR